MSARFEIDEEENDGSLDIIDNATGPDTEAHTIITISGEYGSFGGRRSLAYEIIHILKEQARDGTENIISE